MVKTAKKRKRAFKIEKKQGITLTSQQREALEAMLNFVASREKFFLLTGYAGCGKTTLIQCLFRELQLNGDKRKVVFTAPTNKAVKVLKNMADAWELDIDCMTCFRLLGLKPKINQETGKEEFVRDPDVKASIDRYEIVVIDETSMVNQELWNLLFNEVQVLFNTTKLIFTGDKAQLPPVGESESLVFSQIDRTADLTEVVRFEGAIGVLTETLRNNLESYQLPLLKNDFNASKTKGIFVLNSRAWSTNMLKAFQSEKYLKNPDYCRVLAWTNKRVNYLNQQIRQAIYGSEVPRFVEGERLMAMDTCVKNEEILLPSSAECEILKAKIEQLENDWKIWSLLILDEEEKTKQLQVIHEDSWESFNQVLAKLAEIKNWEQFWKVKKQFHQVNYTYALTVHKGQGSTFENVFVSLEDILRNPKIKERNQLLYVATSRAAERIFVEKV
ncbi:ATP-dependent DNA helicase [Oscillatoria salina]|uniref:ATP-dependent DNA helicase n=1 Tax=Oscillatoria salina TaxID=331517 RepID=UPI0013BD8DBF|nr:AAA family ATPase [Oscillatoria salina]MBZ8181122.1 AAA family ATPase [Oscillatoria salina IIICB1]NET88757.1 AAA family ATPase [Kamptonema sp. SIO1D9]